MNNASLLEAMKKKPGAAFGQKPVTPTPNGMPQLTPAPMQALGGVLGTGSAIGQKPVGQMPNGMPQLTPTPMKAVAGVSTTTASKPTAGLKTYTYGSVSKQFVDDKAERQFRRDNPFDAYSKAREMKFLSDIDAMQKGNQGVSVPQMDEYSRLSSKWNYTSTVPQAPSRTNSNQTVPDYLGMTPEMIQKAMDGLSGTGNQYYDPSKDPVYGSMLELSQKQADKAGLQTMEAMNDRGILNSTITTDRVGQIKQGASDAVLASIPGLASNFDNKMANNNAGLQNLLNSVLGAGQFQQTFAEDNLRFDKNFALDEAAVTGRYLSPESQKLLQNVLQSKQYGSTNQDAINKLAASGVDISGLLGGYDTALNSSYYAGRDTLAQQDMDLKRSETMGKESSTTAQGLIQRIIQLKQMNEKGQGNRAENTKIQNDARARLSAMGYDVTGISGNVSSAKAQANASKMGAPTLNAQKLAAETSIANKELALKGQELTMQGQQFGQKMAFEENSFNREMNYKEQTAMIEADLKSRGYDIEEVKNSINLFSTQSDADYKLHQQSLGITDKDAKNKTQEVINQLMGAKTAAEALAYLHKNGQSLANQGVNTTEVLKSLTYKFPEINKVLDDDDDAGFFNPAKP